MTGVRLEVETLIIQGLSSQVKNLTKAIYRTGIDIDDLVLLPLAAAEAVIDNKQKELGAALIDIGLSTTSIAVFEEGDLLHTAVLPIGSEHITADVAIGLRCPLNLAEKIKLTYGSANPKQFSKRDEVDITDLAEEEQAAGEAKKISKKYIAEIIEARVEEIFEKVDEELKVIERSGMLPAGVFLVGGGTKLMDIVEVAKKQLRLPACLGTNRTVATVIDKVNETQFLPALGLTIWGDNIMQSEQGGSFIRFPGGTTAKKSLGKIKKWFSSLMP
jgi:cell division protein FtsA